MAGFGEGIGHSGLGCVFYKRRSELFREHQKDLVYPSFSHSRKNVTVRLKANVAAPGL
jgi:hypothetical protein